MASGLSNYFAGKIIDHMLRNQSFTPPTSVYVALFTAMPTRSTAGTEVTGGSYARQTATLAAASNGTTTTTADITFPTATADWGEVLGVGFYDLSVAGNLLSFATLVNSRVVNNGTTFKILSGDFDLDFAIPVA